MNKRMPDDLLGYYNNSNELELSSAEGNIELFRKNDLEEINKDYEVESYCPNFLLIGTNGGGVGVFLNRTNKFIYSMPLIGMSEEDANLLAETFNDFMEKLKSGQIEII